MIGGSLPRKMLRDLNHRLPAVTAIGAVVALGVLLFVASYDSFRNVQASYSRTYARTQFADFTVMSADPDRIAAAVHGAEGVDQVMTRTQADQPMTIGDTKLVGRVIGIPVIEDPQNDKVIDRVDVIAGRLPTASGSADEVAMERHSAQTFGIAAGARVHVFDGTEWHDVTVSGVVQSPEYLWPARNRQDLLGDPHAFAVLFAPEPLARNLSAGAREEPNGSGAREEPNGSGAREERNGSGAREEPNGSAAGPTQTLVTMSDTATPSDRDNVTRLLRAAGAVDIEERADQPSHAALQESLHGLSGMAIGFPALFLTAAAIAEYVLISRMIHTERPIIGTLLALGARRGALIRHNMYYGVVIAGTAAIAGVLAGAAATSAYTRLYASLLQLPDTVVQHRISTALIGLALGLIAGVLGALAPALGAARLAPAQAMRGDVVHTHRIGAWTRLSARWSRLPVTARMALRSLTRSRRRTAATMVGCVLALTLILTAAGQLTSVRAMLRVEFGAVQRNDATVLVAANANDAGAQLKSIPGVGAIEPATLARVTVAANGHLYPTALTGLQPDTVMHGFRGTDGRQRSLPSDGVLAGAGLAGQLGVRVGDDITVIPAAGTSTKVRLAGLVDEPLGTALYATTSVAQSMTATGPNGYLLRFAAGADRDRVRDIATGLPGVLAYTDTGAVERQIDGYLVIFWVFAGSMLGLGGLLAFTVICVVMTVNVTERTAELASLRAAGAPIRRLAAASALENLCATALAVPLGLAVGAGVAWGFLRSFNNDLFQLHLSIGPAAMALAVVAVAAAATVSQLPATRLIKRIDVARVVRERSL